MVEVVSEIGINWDGDFELLRDMINKSKDAGCNAIKLQAFERATCNNHPETDRLLSSSVTKNNIEKIDELAKNTGIEWFCTPMYSAAVEFLEPFLERFRTSVKIKAKGSLAMSCKIGEESMEDTDLAANANAVATAIEKTLPNGSKNVKKIMFKTTMGKAIKVEQVKK